MIKILDADLNRLANIREVISAERREEINGENILDFTAVLTSKLSSLISETVIFELNDDYFDIAYFKSDLNEDNTYTIEVESEHVSYRLNNQEYNVEYFTEIGQPDFILGKILEGTEFTVGTVEFTIPVTYSAQEAMSRRQVLMEFAASIGAEINFRKFQIDLLRHRGSSTVKTVIKGRNVKVISKSVDKRKLDSEGSPTVSYTCEPIHIPTADYELGDKILLIQKDLNIHEFLRVVRINYNPYNDMATSFDFASYKNGLADSLYNIITDSVGKDKYYNGCRIGPEFGFEAVRNDKCARAYLRSDGLCMQSGDGSGTTWKDRLYYAYDSNLDETVLVFDGQFTADVIEALSAVITPSLFAEKGYISELTVDELETSDKAQRFLNEDTSDVNYIHIVDQVLRFITASVIPGGTVEQTGSGLWEDAQTDTYYKSVVITPEGIPSFTNGEEKTAFEAFGAGLFYRAIDETSYYKLAGMLQIDLDPASVSYEIYTITLNPEVNYEQATNRGDQPLFWISEDHKAASVKTTEFPVYIYKYNEITKMEVSFSYDSTLEEYVPRISLGLSGEEGENGTGAIYKGKTGLHIDYNSTKGDLRQILMNDAGIILTPFAAVGTSALTVDRLVTDTKIENYLNEDTSDVNYVKIIDQVIQFITASVHVTENTDNISSEQLLNRDDEPLYWFDSDHRGITTDETPFPVYVYTYDEIVKMQNEFYYDYDLGQYIPRIILGAGNSEYSDDGKGVITKTGDGLHLSYYSSVDGELRDIRLGDDGLEFTPELEIGGEAANIASTTLTISIVGTGEFESEEWEHGFDSAENALRFLATPGNYDDSNIQIRDLRVVQTSATTCKIVGYATVAIQAV